MRKFNSLTAFEKAHLKEQLSHTTNIEEMLNVLIKRFDLKGCQPGIITKNILASNLVSVVLPMLNPSEKNG